MKVTTRITLIPLALLAMATGAHATIYTVGSGPFCIFTDLRPALIAAASLTNGPVLIKVATGVDTSLSYSWSSPDSEVVLSNPTADITVEGGYAACTDALPDPNKATFLDYASPSDDSTHTLLTLRNDYANPSHSVTLKHMYVDGHDFNGSKVPPAYGGAFRVEKDMTLILAEGTVVEDFEGRRGGAIALRGHVGSTVPPTVDESPTLEVRGGSRIQYNHAWYSGGGVYADRAKVIMQGGVIYDNGTDGNGGGLYLAAELGGFAVTPTELTVKQPQGDNYNSISGNNAGDPESFNANSGNGGGIYAYKADIYVEATLHGRTLTMGFNSANSGGAIAVAGNGATANRYSHSTIVIWDTLIANNTARNRGGALYALDSVHWLFFGSHSATVPHEDKIGPSMVFYNNLAQGISDSYGGGVAYIASGLADGGLNGEMGFNRVWFLDNAVSDGDAVAFAALEDTELQFKRSIFDGNHRDDAGIATLIHDFTELDVRLTYSTLVNNDVDHILKTWSGSAKELNLQGSILWNPEVVKVLDKPTGGSETVTHAQCLIAYNTAGLPSGAWSWEPQLGAGYAPSGTSPAIDHCDSVNFQPVVDFNGADVPYNTPGIAPRWNLTPPANWDLGAVEQTDVLFANTFGIRTPADPGT